MPSFLGVLSSYGATQKRAACPNLVLVGEVSGHV